MPKGDDKPGSVKRRDFLAGSAVTDGGPQTGPTRELSTGVPGEAPVWATGVTSKLMYLPASAEARV